MLIQKRKQLIPKDLQKTVTFHALESYFGMAALLLNLEKWRSGEDRQLPSFANLTFREVEQQSLAWQVTLLSVPAATLGRVERALQSGLR